MAFAEFPYGFLVARRDDGLFFAVVFLGAALADELRLRPSMVVTIVRSFAGVNVSSSR